MYYYSSVLPRFIWPVSILTVDATIFQVSQHFLFFTTELEFIWELLGLPTVSCWILVLLFSPDDGSSMFLRNFREFLPDYTASHPKGSSIQSIWRLFCLASFLFKNKIFWNVATLPSPGKNTKRTQLDQLGVNTCSLSEDSISYQKHTVSQTQQEPGYLSHYSDLATDPRGFHSREGQETFLFSTAFTPALRPTQSSTQKVPRVAFLVLKLPERETGYSPPSSAEVSNTWGNTSIPTHVFMAWCLSTDTTIP
jgi:hypothetical protein